MSNIDRYDSIKMLTSSSSQYLPPDYLQPLPTTLDAKNSPLALLAQTCSSIGKDPPSKPIIPPIEKKDQTSKSPASDGNSGSKSVSPKQKESSVQAQEKPRSNTSESKEIATNFRPISTSSPKPGRHSVDIQKVKDERKTCDSDRKSPSVESSRVINSPVSNNVHRSHATERNSPKSKSADISRDHGRDVRYTPPPKRQRSESPAPKRDYSPSSEGKHQHSMYPGFPLGPLGFPPMAYGSTGIPSSAEALAAAGYPFPLPGQNGYSLASAHASALAAHQAALKSAGSSAALSQYMHYNRLRNPSAGLSVCKDPYCTNCVSSIPGAHVPSQCTSPGCTQCSHEKSLQSLGALGGLPGSNPYSPFSATTGLNSASGLSALHSLYAQNLLSQQQQGQQHVCNWMAGSDYCGKRFSTSEELLQHLRTHTAGGESALSAYSSLGLAIPPPAELAAGLPGYLGTPGNISPETLRRMYPTSISPIGSSGLASRYHPYKSGIPNVPSGLPPHQSLSSLGPYYSAYNMFGQRIGAAAVP